MDIENSNGLNNESSLSPVDKDVIDCSTPSPTLKVHRRSNSGNFYLPHTPHYAWYQYNEESSHQSYCASPISPLRFHPILYNEHLDFNCEADSSLDHKTTVENDSAFTFSEVNSNSPIQEEVSSNVLSSTQERMTCETSDNNNTMLKNSDRVKLLANETNDSSCIIV